MHSLFPCISDSVYSKISTISISIIYVQKMEMSSFNFLVLLLCQDIPNHIAQSIFVDQTHLHEQTELSLGIKHLKFHIESRAVIVYIHN